MTTRPAPFPFPRIASEDAFAAWRRKPRHWSDLVQAIARAEAVPLRDPAAFPGGTNLVVDLNGTAVLKLFPPFYLDQFVSERDTLRRLAGRLSLPIPDLLAEGQHEGWSWLIIGKLGGTIGSAIWPGLDEDGKRQILHDLGAAITEVQAVALSDPPAGREGWRTFVERQMAACVGRHREQGLPPRFLPDLARLAAEAPQVIPLDAPDVTLTGEWIPENFLLSQENGRWRLSALIDFGDVRRGWGEYDLLGPSAFMCEGRPERVAALFAGYGIEPDAALRRRLLTLMVLHQESDLRKLSVPGWQDRASSLFDLENLLWPA